MQWIVFGILTLLVVNGVRRMVRESAAARKPFEPSASAKKPSPKIEVQETVQCPVCQTYVIKNTKACGRDGCPFGA